MEQRVSNIEKDYLSTLDHIKKENDGNLQRKDKEYKKQIHNIHKQHEQEIVRWEQIYEEAVKDYAKQCDKMEQEKMIAIMQIREEARAKI